MNDLKDVKNRIRLSMDLSAADAMTILVVYLTGKYGTMIASVAMARFMDKASEEQLNDFLNELPEFKSDAFANAMISSVFRAVYPERCK